MRTVSKGWGREVIFADHENYCGKLLVFFAKGSKMSMHFHKTKDETWYVQTGSFILRVIDTKTGITKETYLKTGESWHNPPFLPHQLEALENNSTIFEVSTYDDPEDNYRVGPGDSQK